MIKIEDILKKINMPASYMKFREEIKPPFIVYFSSGSENFVADNKVYHSEYNYVIEYYFTKKSREEEMLIEQTFNKEETVWTKSEDIYIQSEDMYLIRYYI